MFLFQALLMQIWIYMWLYTSLIAIYSGISSPIQPLGTYEHSIDLQTNVASLWWSVNDIKQEITFELHMKTIGWIALGISPGRKDNKGFSSFNSNLIL